MRETRAASAGSPRSCSIATSVCGVEAVRSFSTGEAVRTLKGHGKGVNTLALVSDDSDKGGFAAMSTILSFYTPMHYLSIYCDGVLWTRVDSVARDLSQELLSQRRVQKPFQKLVEDMVVPFFGRDIDESRLLKEEVLSACLHHPPDIVVL